MIMVWIWREARANQNSMFNDFHFKNSVTEQYNREIVKNSFTTQETVFNFFVKAVLYYDQ